MLISSYPILFLFISTPSSNFSTSYRLFYCGNKTSAIMCIYPTNTYCCTHPLTRSISERISHTFILSHYADAPGIIPREYIFTSHSISSTRLDYLSSRSRGSSRGSKSRSGRSSRGSRRCTKNSSTGSEDVPCTSSPTGRCAARDRPDPILGLLRNGATDPQ